MGLTSIEAITGKQLLPENTNVLERTQQVIQIALEKMGYNEAFYELLKEPLKLLTVMVLCKFLRGIGHSIMMQLDLPREVFLSNF